MDNYFEATKDAEFLDPKIREEGTDLQFVVEEAKALLERYITSFDYHCDAYKITEDGLPDRYIYLRGYNPDPEEAAASLVRQVKRCIADIVRWRLWSKGINPHVASEGGQQSGRSNRLNNVRERIPVEALRHLNGYLIVREVHVL